MQIPLQITVRNMARSPALDERIRNKVQALERFHPRITHCRVTVSELQKHHQQGRQFDVRIDVRVPGHAEIAVTRQHDEDVYVAVRDAFDAATRMIEDVLREKRGDVKFHETPQEGTVKRILRDEGFGFIETNDGRELYFSRDNVVHPAFEHLEEGAHVQFLEVTSDEGLQAKRVSSGKHHFPPA
jgi:ribosomal subunit interface protein